MILIKLQVAAPFLLWGSATLHATAAVDAYIDDFSGLDFLKVTRLFYNSPNMIDGECG